MCVVCILGKSIILSKSKIQILYFSGLNALTSTDNYNNQTKNWDNFISRDIFDLNKNEYIFLKLQVMYYNIKITDFIKR